MELWAQEAAFGIPWDDWGTEIDAERHCDRFKVTYFQFDSKCSTREAREDGPRHTIVISKMAFESSSTERNGSTGP